MAKTGPFDKWTARYDQWFEKNNLVYLAELEAIKRLLPTKGKGIEIGVGTGHFAAPLGIQWGLDPSAQMLKIAVQRGIHVIEGVAEKLPFADAQFDFVLMVTTICFLDDIEAAFREVWRILKPPGCFIVGFIDKNSLLGREYQENKDGNEFYKIATFYSVEEVIAIMKRAGFSNFDFVQTIFQSTDKIRSPEPIEDGYGQGAFVVIRGQK
jgi:ubiquinone/menaquinone biosynthesis C-methylase UbiE